MVTTIDLEVIPDYKEKFFVCLMGVKEE